MQGVLARSLPDARPHAPTSPRYNGAAHPLHRGTSEQPVSSPPLQRRGFAKIYDPLHYGFYDLDDECDGPCSLKIDVAAAADQDSSNEANAYSAMIGSGVHGGGLFPFSLFPFPFDFDFVCLFIYICRGTFVCFRV
jgi:hypothetical protein